MKQARGRTRLSRNSDLLYAVYEALGPTVENASPRAHGLALMGAAPSYFDRLSYAGQHHVRWQPLMNTRQHTVLFIDGYHEDRRSWAEGFHMSSPEAVVLQADSGAAGLAMCRSQRVDCVVVELSLPDMSGFQVLVNLVPSGHKPTVAVIVFTRLPLLLMAEVAKTIGAQAFLLKSDTSSDQLKAAVRHAIGKLTASAPHSVLRDAVRQLQ